MIKTIQISILFVATMCLLVACKSMLKPAGETHFADALPEINIEDIFRGLNENRYHFDALAVKIDVDVITKNTKESFSGNLRLQQDSAIWVSVRKFGFEGVRVLITPDSVKMINRLEKKYFIGAFESLNRLFDVNVNFLLLQALMTGNDINDDIDKSCVHLTDTIDRYLSVFCPERKIVNPVTAKTQKDFFVQQHVSIDTSTYKIIFNRVKPLNDFRVLKASYSNYLPDDNGNLFPMLMVFELETENLSTVIVTVNKVKDNQNLKMPFKLPDKYEVVTLRH
ncbi:MAG: DUF4292 domain-containing protein [Bacteroidales bacterium]|nr:DUF4292 domain-containing protein [Bacteroidales bacterium]